MILVALDQKNLDFTVNSVYPVFMTETKDQKPAESGDATKVVEANVEPLSMEEIDKEIAAADPQFLDQIKDIKITGTNVDLSVMNQAFYVLAQSEVTLKDKIKELFSYSKNPKRFMSFWGSFLAVGVLLFVTWGVRKTFLDQKLFMTSFADLGGTVRDYNPLTETEVFYDNTKFSKNIVMLSKMFINLKASESSGPNPMLALELNVEGLSSDAIIELKDREAEFKDLLIRTTEEKTYDDLVMTKGKQELCDQFRQLINSNLTRGQVRKVLLNSFIIKP